MPFQKNTAVTGFSVGLVSATDGSDITTGTPVGYYTLDGGAQTAINDTSPVHEGSGLWSFDLLQAEMNGDVVALTFTHTSAITAHFTIKTETVLVSDLNDFNSASDTVTTVTTVTNQATDYATDTALATAQTDLDTITGGDGAIIASAQTVATVTDVTNQVTADVTAISGDTTSADNLRESTTALEVTTVDTTPSPTAISFTLVAGSNVDNVYLNRAIFVVSGINKGLFIPITGYDQATRVVSFDATLTLTIGDKIVIA